MQTKIQTNLNKIKRLETRLRSLELSTGMTPPKSVPSDLWERTFGVMRKTKAKQILRHIRAQRKTSERKL